jgi:release factor glutamine methyltransferase
MTTAKSFYQSFQQEITPKYGEREAYWIARAIFEDLYGIKGIVETQDFPQEPPLEKVTERILNEEPVQYVTGCAYFHGLKLQVSPEVLIPRPETEELVEWVLATYPTRKEMAVLDVGTGSGCIALALKKHKSYWQVDALDASPGALAIAEANANLYKLDIDFFQLDFLDQSVYPACAKYDLIVSNPPYIPPSEKKLMARNVLDFEPAMALFVPENDPLVFYKALGVFGKKHLNKEGCLFVECNTFKAGEVADLWVEMGYQEVEIKEDLEGKPRMVKAKTNRKFQY